MSIARVLAAEPDGLVLDEPTSALDLASEAAVQASLTELQGRLTLFVVAHRVSTISACDRILVMAERRIEAFAVAAELELSSAFYQGASALARGIA
jgi:ABC-type multidrug transport system fused ATPase/permease subunit